MQLVERTQAVATRDGTMRVFATSPAAPEAAPAVVMYMDAIGFRGELRELARRVARHGYACFLPDLYYRDGGPSFDPHRPDRDLDRFAPLMQKLTREAIVADTAALLAMAHADTRVRPGAAACIGFCMGGRFAVWAAGAFPDTFAACASLHGGRLGTDAPDSPHRFARSMRCELYLGFASDDPLVPPAHIATLEGALRDAGVAFESEVHAGTEHGYMFPERYCYHEAAAANSWNKVFALFARRLPPGPA